MTPSLAANSSDSAIRLGTRSSRLALWQAEHVAELLRAGGHAVELVHIETTGDLDQVHDFGSIGAKGIFVKEIEAALLDRRIDLAVHSLKDLPTDLPEGLVLGAALERASPLDALVSRDGLKFEKLPPGARIATGSLRRAAQALALRPDLEIVPLRGNVPTRVRKIREGAADATLMAAAGLTRLGMEGEIAQVFAPELVTPAMGQGSIAIESRAGEFADALARLNHAPTRTGIDAERVFISRIGGGCKTPVGVLARAEEHAGWSITAMVASSDGKSLLRERCVADSAAGLLRAAMELADSFLASADTAILATLNPPERSPTPEGAR